MGAFYGPLFDWSAMGHKDVRDAVSFVKNFRSRGGIYHSCLSEMIGVYQPQGLNDYQRALLKEYKKYV